MAKNAEKETALYEAVFRLLARGEKMYSVTVQQIAEEAGIGKRWPTAFAGRRTRSLSG